MKKPAPSRTKAFPLFQKGQLWRIGELTLVVTLVGKTYVHYKRYTTQPLGCQIALTPKLSLQDYLVISKAVLISG